MSFTVVSTLFWFSLYIVSEFPSLKICDIKFPVTAGVTGSNAEIRVPWRRTVEKQSERYPALLFKGRGELYINDTSIVFTFLFFLGFFSR